MKKAVRVVLLILLFAAVGAAFYTFGFREVSSPDRLMVSGTIEITEVPLSFKIPGRLAERLLDEGADVKRGQTIARLERVDQERVVAREEAQLAQAEAQLAELETGSRPQEIANVRAELEQAQAAARAISAELQQAKADDERFTELYTAGATTQREFELYRTRHRSAQEAAAEAQSRIDSVRARLDLVTEGPRRETIDAARARVNVARQSLALARQQLEDTELRAPIDGVVLNKSAEPGAYLSPGMPVVVIGDMARPWLRAYVNEPDIGRLQLNQEVFVVTDAFPDERFPGRISFISSDKTNIRDQVNE